MWDGTGSYYSQQFAACPSSKRFVKALRIWFQLNYPNLSRLQYCVLLLCVYDCKTSHVRGFNSTCTQWWIQTRRLGGSKIGGRQKCLHLLKYQRLSATIVVCHTKEVIFCRSKSGYFCWLNYATFQGITTVWKRFTPLIQKTFETGPKQWASFFTSYTDLVYLQNVFKRYKSMLCASACHCFGYP